MPEPIRVLIADDHPVYRDGIVRAIERTEDFELVAECGDGDQALERIRRLKPDVAVLDLRMNGPATPELVAAVADETNVLVLSAVADSEAVTAVLEAGASGYLTKETSREAICAGIRRVAAGETVVGHEAQRTLVTALRETRARDRDVLTDRERECLELLVEGLSVPAIAERLILGQSTVKHHLRGLYEKLGVSDRAAAVAEGMRRGIVS